MNTHQILIQILGLAKRKPRPEKLPAIPTCQQVQDLFVKGRMPPGTQFLNIANDGTKAVLVLSWWHKESGKTWLYRLDLSQDSLRTTDWAWEQFMFVARCDRSLSADLSHLRN